MLMASTLYEVLRLPPPPSNECGVADVKRAYKKLALKLHPDRCKEELAEEAFKRLEEAHRTLTTPTLDDVTALSVLYPLPCEASRVLDGLDPYSAPSSTKYAVWVLLATFAVPLFILVILLPPCGMFAKWLRAGLTPVPDPNAGRKRQKKADFFKAAGQTPVGMAAPDVESATA